MVTPGRCITRTRRMWAKRAHLIGENVTVCLPPVSAHTCHKRAHTLSLTLTHQYDQTTLKMEGFKNLSLIKGQTSFDAKQHISTLLRCITSRELVITFNHSEQLETQKQQGKMVFAALFSFPPFGI